jgi:hypothetical protein
VETEVVALDTAIPESIVEPLARVRSRKGDDVADDAG